MHILLFSLHLSSKVGLGYHGNWFCLSPHIKSVVWCCVRFNRFSRGWRDADPAVVLCETISRFGLPFPMNVWSLHCWGNDAVTSVKRKVLWQLPPRIRGASPVWEAAWHCDWGTTCTIWCTHLCTGRLQGSDNVTEADASAWPHKVKSGAQVTEAEGMKFYKSEFFVF